ncbi:MAG TPA: tRNA uridine-5-carboxymethylaminomethyl(34) synthesis GTPase MnmE [Chitinophagaceae bacterium]|nr:tRNA uridine-5-carboxymethylaminomethyl(34) synthesis GTPase MnmE [Chitinophagaceae bacterium]
MYQHTNWDDTIVALATPPGIGAIGVIRLSGAKAIAIAAALFHGKELLAQPSHTLHVGLLKDGDTVLDEVVVSLFCGPRSYTGEDVVEISCHGSSFIQEQVIKACLQKGARLAGPGEFTQRAFLNGKLDLTQAEAVADLIASQSNSAQRAAMHNLRGGFSADLRSMREQLINFSALIELELDFSQEDVEFADRSKLHELIERLTQFTSQLISSFSLGNAIKNGVKVAIIGKPNAGKSTLLNALLNEERAIVSDIAGTTRDTIEEIMNIDGILFRFMDTAGIREHTTDKIEEMGIERSRKKAAEADIVLYIYDAKNDTPQGLLSAYRWLKDTGNAYLFIVNKMDEAASGFAVPEDAVPIIAKSNTGINDLKQRLKQLIVSDTVQTEGTLITNARHHAALQQVLSALQDIKAGMDNGLPGDLLALDIRRCLHYISEITGDINTDRDILGTIFGKFCIGK